MYVASVSSASFWAQHSNNQYLIKLFIKTKTKHKYIKNIYIFFFIIIMNFTNKNKEKKRKQKMVKRTIDMKDRLKF